MFDKRLFALVPKARIYILGNVFFQWVALVVNIALMLVIGMFFAALVQGNITELGMFQLGVFALLSLVVRFVCIYLAQSCSQKASALAKTQLRLAIFDKLSDLGSHYTEHIKTSEAVQIAVEGCEQLETYFGLYVPQLFFAFIAPVTLFVLLAPFNFIAALIPFICVPLIPISIVSIQRIAKKVVGKYWGSYTNLGAHFLENLQGLTTLKIYQADQAQQDSMNQDAENFRRATMRVLRMQLNSITVMDLIAFGGAAVSICVVLSQTALGNMSLAAAFAFIMLSAEFFIPMRLLGSFFHVAMSGMAASNRMFQLFGVELNTRTDNTLDGPVKSLVFENLSFAYTKEKPILKDINLDFSQAGQGSHGLFALVGPSGSGKSTIAALMSGTLTPSAGKVLVNGQDLQEISRNDRVRLLTSLGFNEVLFAGTVRENLLLAAPDASDQELLYALDRVKLKDFLLQHQGLDFMLEEDASNLSGGQKQRLNLARALLHKSDIYVFDEVCSNIDTESEQAILALIEELSHDKLVLMITHRLSSVVNVDKIFVLDHGHIVQAGTHQELLAQPGLYADLYTQQAELESFLQSNQAHNQHVLEIQLDEVPQKNLNASKAVSTSSASAKSSRTQLEIMSRLVKLVAPLKLYMALAVILGVLGFLAAIFLTIFGAWGLSEVFVQGNTSIGLAMALVVLCGVVRGPLRYGEQLCNHYIAFKLLALIRDRVYTALRRLSPAKLETRKKGELISLIGSDIELLEVFYAHTLSPIMIATLTCLVMLIFIGFISPVLAVVALLAYLGVGLVIPLIANAFTQELGRALRAKIASLNAFVLESLRGFTALIQYGAVDGRRQDILAKSNDLNDLDHKLKNRAGLFRSCCQALIIIFDISFILISAILVHQGLISTQGALIATIALMSSFGPVLATAELGSSLQSTLASGGRVLDLLDEEPQVRENQEGKTPEFTGFTAKDLSFAYGSSDIFSKLNLEIRQGTLVGLSGKSGSGKSSFLKLLMRFWDIDSGELYFGKDNLKELKTSHLRDYESYMTQTTHLFAGTLRSNIALVKPHASDEEILSACKKADLEELVSGLSKGLDTPVAELGSSLSGGEKQRIGLARMFLYDAPICLLDEPTSNLDGLSEARVLKALVQETAGKTVLVVSHRPSTLSFVDQSIVFTRKRSNS